MELNTGMALILADGGLNVLESAFNAMDGNRTGRLTLQELDDFMRLIAPSSTNPQIIGPLAERLLKDMDEGRKGYIDAGQFKNWPGSMKMLEWVESYQEKTLTRYNTIAREARSYEWRESPEGTMRLHGHDGELSLLESPMTMVSPSKEDEAL